MNKIIEQDIQEFIQSFPLSEELEGTSFLITGSTGLIGSILVNCLLSLNKNIRIVAPVRNKNKALALFSDSFVEIIECDLLSFDYSIIGNVDYVVHCAAPTSSKYFVEYPVETASFIFETTKKLLDYSVCFPVRCFLYLSSIEVYGAIQKDDPITEDVQGYINPLDIRSSYPMAKRMAENLCALYFREYGVPTKIARLTQTTGAGIAKDDNRIIAQFARLGIQGKDIILHTKGESARPYCYTIDAVSGLLFILIKGNLGEAYNIANEETYISAIDMAYYIKQHINNSINVRVELNDSFGYAPPSKIFLSSAKLRHLGWFPKYQINSIFEKLISYLIER